MANYLSEQTYDIAVTQASGFGACASYLKVRPFWNRLGTVLRSRKALPEKAL
jgi:hypothetical protein